MFWIKQHQAQPAELRRFGLLIAAVTAVVFGLALPLLHHHHLPLWPWIALVVMGIPALVAPVLLRPLYTVWMSIAHVLGWINTRILLGLVYWSMIVPIGLFKQGLAKVNNGNRKTEIQQESYRIVEKPRPRNNYKRIF